MKTFTELAALVANLPITISPMVRFSIVALRPGRPAVLTQRWFESVESRHR